MLSAKPRAANGADEGYDSDVTRDDTPSKVAVVATTPAVATALPATRRSARTQKADAQDIVEKLSALQTAEPSVGGKKRGAPESQYESQGACGPLLSPLACRHLTFALPRSQAAAQGVGARAAHPAAHGRSQRSVLRALNTAAATCAHVAFA